MSAFEKEPEGWSASDKFTVVLETAGSNATELSAYCRERGLFPEQVSRLCLYPYLVVGVWSRKVVGWDVAEGSTSHQRSQNRSWRYP